jgi:hypothetical protein
MMPSLLMRALTTADLVFGQASSDIESTDEATIRTVSRVELEYISKDQGYTQRPASFSDAGDQQFNPGPAIFLAAGADRSRRANLRHEKYFELQASRRTTRFRSGEVRYLPGDVVSVPKRGDHLQRADRKRRAQPLTCRSTSRPRFPDRGLDHDHPGHETGLSPVAVTLQTQYIHLDVPLFRYADDLGGAGLRQYGVVASRGQAGWGGGVLYRGDTSAELSPLLSQAPQNGVIGVCVDVLNGPARSVRHDRCFDRHHSQDGGRYRVAGRQDRSPGACRCELRLYRRAGRWEGVGYKTAVDNGDGTFTLSGFTIRGYRGTEVFAYDHQVGDQFVMIDAGMAEIGHASAHRSGRYQVLQGDRPVAEPGDGNCRAS